MKRKIFGTDGVRGKANVPPMTPDMVMRLAIAAGRHFTRGDHRHRVVIGKDTRLSGYMLEPSLTAGFTSVGMDVTLVGPLPTPAVAMLTRTLRADLGVMISASHNPYEDNGLKFFGPDGQKLSDAVERQIEDQVLRETTHARAPSSELGRARRMEDAPGRYIEFVKNTFPKSIRLDGLKIVIDCAHGAAYKVAPPVFWELGADIIPLSVNPDGCNINKNCGATSVDAMCQAVLDHKADLGIALDGDADRVVMADEKGCVINGDQLMALIATSWQKAGRLQGAGIVATVMSNLGLERYLEAKGLRLERTQVGDRYVRDRMHDQGYNIGGEQSGHIILSDYTTTGDGLIAALQVLSVLVASQKPASEICQVFTPLPQKLKSLKIVEEDPLTDPKVQEAIAVYEKELEGRGRLLIRKSGTEPLVRIMVEAEERPLLDQVLEGLTGTISDVIQRKQRVA